MGIEDRRERDRQAKARIRSADPAAWADKIRKWRRTHPLHAAEVAKRWRTRHPDRARATARAVREKSAERIKLRKREYQAKNRAAIAIRKKLSAKPLTPAQKARYAESERRRRALNPESFRAYERAWCKANPDKAAARANRHRCAMQKAFWDFPENRELIELVYAEARHRRLCVDHVVPLQGVNVCGLHVFYNMQLLTNSQNCAKRNFF